MVKGAIISMSRKKKLNAKISTEYELVVAGDAPSLILWTKLFMEPQGYTLKTRILYQDNKSTILLQVNSKELQ